MYKLMKNIYSEDQLKDEKIYCAVLLTLES